MNTPKATRNKPERQVTLPNDISMHHSFRGKISSVVPANNIY
jgi:hypothetical protein